MRIENEFVVAAPLEHVWAYMLDVEKVAPCVPGAQLTEVVDDHTWKGRVTLKLGPVSLVFGGTVTITELDEAAHRVVLKAEGREQKGKGAASATSTSVLAPMNGSTRVTIETDLTITGAVAQYGRGMIGDVSQRLIQQFADCLQANMAGEEVATPSEPAPVVAPAPAPAQVAEVPVAEPIPVAEPAPIEAGPVAPVEAQHAAPIQPASGLGGTASPVEPDPPGPAGAPQDRPAQTRPVGGIRLGLWALWRAVVRFFRRLSGGRRP